MDGLVGGDDLVERGDEGELLDAEEELALGGGRGAAEEVLADDAELSREGTGVGGESERCGVWGLAEGGASGAASRTFERKRWGTPGRTKTFAHCRIGHDSSAFGGWRRRAPRGKVLIFVTTSSCTVSASFARMVASI